MPDSQPVPGAEPFWGEHQGGIATPAQAQSYFAALDLVTKHRRDLGLMRAWTGAAARLSQGHPATPIGRDLSTSAGDSGDTLGLGASRLTLTFGFGAGLFVRDGGAGCWIVPTARGTRPYS
jgi:deferrochelatase/peroxidase EfeB